MTRKLAVDKKMCNFAAFPGADLAPRFILSAGESRQLIKI